MTDPFDSLLASYERGVLTRRQLLQALLVMVLIQTSLHAQEAGRSLMKGLSLHHVNVRVSDVARSEAFSACKRRVTRAAWITSASVSRVVGAGV